MEETMWFEESSASGHTLICSYVDEFGEVVNQTCDPETEKCCGTPSFYWCCERSDLAPSNEVIIGLAAAAVIIFVFVCVFFVYCVLSVPQWCQNCKGNKQMGSHQDEEQLELQDFSGRVDTVEATTPLVQRPNVEESTAI